MLRPILAVALLLSLLAPAAAYADSITVTDGWIRALPAPTPSAGYFILTNDSGRRLALTGASSPACGSLMLHKSETTGGMASMSDVEEVPIAIGATLRFSPGTYHLMCMQPTAAIRPGNKVPVTLVFSDGPRVTTEFLVRDATGN